MPISTIHSYLLTLRSSRVGRGLTVSENNILSICERAMKSSEMPAEKMVSDLSEPVWLEISRRIIHHTDELAKDRAELEKYWRDALDI